MNKIVLVLSSAAILSLTGCASVLNDSTQVMRIDTKTAEGSQVKGADCTLTNDAAKFSSKSGDSIIVKRSSSDMNIACTHPDYPDAKGNAVSRANGAMFGNILLGGVIGAIVDNSNGKGYTYPTWVELIFGKSVVLDRKNEVSGTPLAGVEAPNTAQEKTAAK